MSRSIGLENCDDHHERDYSAWRELRQTTDGEVATVGVRVPSSGWLVQTLQDHAFAIAEAFAARTPVRLVLTPAFQKAMPTARVQDLVTRCGAALD